MYSSKTNEMQRYTMVFIPINALHVPGGSSAQHQELKTVYTAPGICRDFLLLTAITIAVRRRKTRQIPGAVYTVLSSWWWAEEPPGTC